MALFPQRTEHTLSFDTFVRDKIEKKYKSRLAVFSGNLLISMNIFFKYFWESLLSYIELYNFVPALS